MIFYKGYIDFLVENLDIFWTSGLTLIIIILIVYALIKSIEFDEKNK